MPELIKTRVRAIGTSFGVIIPLEALRAQNVKEGEDIEITILKKNKDSLQLIRESFGIIKGVRIPFVRDKSDRIEKYDTS